MSPTARSLKHLRGLGFLADPVERWVERIKRHRDLFRVADVLAVHPRDKIVMLVQATSAAHVGDRLRRLQARPETRLLLQAGLLVEVWGWELYRGRWQARRVALRPEDLEPVDLTPRPSRRKRKGERQRELFP